MSKGESAEDIRAQLQTIDPYQFEHFVAELWEERGWDTEVMQASNDKGVDVEAVKTDGMVDQKAVIQAKRYSDGNKVGRPKIQQYHSLKEQDSDADVAVVVTTSDFTKDAKLWAHDHNVKLIDGDDLGDILREENQYDLLEEYASEPEPTPSEGEADSNGGGLIDELLSGGETNSNGAEVQEPDTNGLVVSGSDYFSFVFLAFVIQVGTIALMYDPTLVPVVTVNMAFWLGFLAWLSQPVLVFADTNDLKKSKAAVQPNRIVWPLVVFFVPIIGMLLYLKRRVTL